MTEGGLDMPVGGRWLLVGFGHGEGGSYLVLDALDRLPWQREVVFVRGQTFTLRRCEERHCIGRHDLDTGRSAPCPERASLDASYEQCSPCFVATGFNPAF
jgi:hypothetical protein